ncbi:MAG: crossover junction endodeoxyribonuclease RuvC [Deltaproteobacteria bacterium]
MLGVDPGTIKTGWGVVDCQGSRMGRVGSGTIKTGRGCLAERLGVIYAEVRRILEEYQPEEVSLESAFVARNVQSALRLGEARGVVIAAAAASGLYPHEYTPATIKKAVAGYGRADKAQMQSAVARLFVMEEVPAEDEADGLAVAVCHCLRRGFDDKVARSLASDPARRLRGRSKVQSR